VSHHNFQESDTYSYGIGMICRAFLNANVP